MSYTNYPPPYGDFYDPPPTASTKDPSDVFSYTFLFSQEFQNEPGDSIQTINSVSYSPGSGILPNLAPNGSPSIIPDPCTGVAAQAVSVPVQGGVVETVYTISVFISTVQGNSFKRSLFVPVNLL